MQVINYPKQKNWSDLFLRPNASTENVERVAKDMFDAVQQEGDAALFRYTRQFDKADVNSFRVSEEELTKSGSLISKELKAAIQLAKKNIETFHATQKNSEGRIETSKGVNCWRESRPIERIGLYIPGGTAPLFSTVLMLGVPAKLAGCKEIYLCSPPDKNGNINPLILYTAQLIGITSIYKVGGIQAIAALSFGTESIPKVDKIFGPGNQYVTAAKQLAQQLGITIDLPAGPSEVLIIADKSCIPEFVAADLLSQAEHGEDSQVMLLSDNAGIVALVITAMEEQLQMLPRKEIAIVALRNSKVILLENTEECIAFSNGYAPEHLILAIEDSKKVIPKIMSAGSVFIGNYSCESAGDYASGTNHTLPTNGYAKTYSGVSLDSFVKKITFQEVSKEGLRNIGPAIELMSEAEQLMGHKNAVSIRLKNL